MRTRAHDNDARSELLARYRAQLAAMTRGDTSALDALLSDDFTLTHLTGYVQAKDEWLAEMRDGQFQYHRIDERSVDVTGATGRLIGRFLVDATVYGSRATWRLQLAQTFARYGGTWWTTSSVATLW